MVCRVIVNHSRSGSDSPGNGGARVMFVELRCRQLHCVYTALI
jgi:hypothetical protein